MKKLAKNLLSVFLALSLFLSSIAYIIPPQPVYADEEPNHPVSDENSPNRGERTSNELQGTNDDSSAPNADALAEDESSPDRPTDSDPKEEDKEEDKENQEDEEPVNICSETAGPLSWILCTSISFLGSLMDSIIDIIENFFDINTVSSDTNSPVHLVWQYVRNITNIVFIIFILIVIYSQITGLGINNYGVKRILPRIIIAVLLVNLSYIICMLMIDVSNVLGNSFRDFFIKLEPEILGDANIDELTWTKLVGLFTGAGVTIALFGSFVGSLTPYLFMLIPIIISGAISLLIGLVTIAARQAIVALLVMIAPLAFVAYLLPNTEKWFSRWRELLFRMLIFYPLFSFLIGSSRLLGYALITAAKDPFSALLGFAIQVIPLFFAFSLMKMSGTILGNVNSALAKLASPVSTSASGWAASHAERRRQHTIANSRMPGARLRRTLDYRKKLREEDTANSTKIRENLAAERTYDKMASRRKRDANGNDQWRKRANTYTKNAKKASYLNTRAATSQEALANTLNQYGDHFGTLKKQGRLAQNLTASGRANKLSGAHATAYEENMMQKFLTVNNAQADQDYLLNKYISAGVNRYEPGGEKEFNRLFKNAYGSLGHIGEGSIMGQVISESVRIEQRRRQEARVVANKFGVKKPQFRGMVFDCEYIDDDGYETNANGEKLHDSQYRFYKGKKHSPWKQFIAVHKETQQEITSDQYNRLSSKEQEAYKRINYMEITDDKNKPIQRVYADDAGYMKELLTDDIAIGDPINRRYLTEIGRKFTDEELGELQNKYHVTIPENFDNRDGILRRYHSSITTALLTSRYKDHAAEVTPMLTAQSNNGYVLNISQNNIANLDSLIKASKSGSILQNDAYAINTWKDLINCVNSTENGKTFADFFPDEAIATYRNVNGLPLHGYREINGKWEKIDRTAPDITLEDRKNFIKHKMIPDAAKKLAGSLNRNISPNILDGQKPDSLIALDQLLETLKDVSIDNINPNLSSTEKLNPDVDIFGSPDPGFLQYAHRLIRSALNQIREGENIDEVEENLDASISRGRTGAYRSSKNNNNSNRSGASNNSGASGSYRSNKNSQNYSGQGTTASNSRHESNSGRDGLDEAMAALGRVKQRSVRRNKNLDLTHIINLIENEICGEYATSYTRAAEQLFELFSANPPLDLHLEELKMIIEDHRHDDIYSTEDAINASVNNSSDNRQERINALCAAVLDLIISILSK